LSVHTQKELVVHTLQRLNTEGFVVDCLTMDGHASDLTMARLLGAELNDHRRLKPYFCMDGDHKTFVLLDPCHVIKLVRNLLQAYGSIKSPDDVIEWKYIVRLQGVQNNIGLRLANKLSDRHINFMQNKMKVTNFCFYIEL
jgi:hypothetical protein